MERRASRAIAVALVIAAAASVSSAARRVALLPADSEIISSTTTTINATARGIARGAGSSSTTTTLIPPPPTTTLDEGRDISGGGRFHGGFTTGQYDLFYFDVTTPVVIVAETSDADGLCTFNTTMELRLGSDVLAFDDDSGPSFCSRITHRLEEPGTYFLEINGASGSAVPDYYLDVQLIETECGNGRTELLEDCDDANTVHTDCCSNTCTKKADGAGCDDGLVCNGSDTCAGGYCTTHSLNPCPGTDGDGNCAETCNDVTSDCTSPDPDWVPCDDGLFCNGADRCLAGVCGQHGGDPCRGTDGDGDCTESCNEASNNCTAPDVGGTDCDDGRWCNGTDKCQLGLCSAHTGNPCPGPDGDGNCTESCDEAKENCTRNDPLNSLCNDGLFCTGTDRCSGGTCTLHTGSDCPGPDGDSNCAESCNEATQQCTALDPSGAACDDGLFCNGADTCSAGACSTHAGNPCPGPDGDGNCAESCNETADACSAADSNGSPCNDGLFCNGADTCSNGACTVHAGSPCLGPDGDGNCAESCNETLDTCTAADPNGSPCNDGLFCNGADTCSAGACSVHGTSPCPGADGDGNCAESCNESTDTCNSNDPNGSSCSDGLFCNGADTCAAGACTGHAGDPCPGPDGDANCAESCNETADACTTADANGAACNDGVFCNGADTCASGACTGHAGNPCPGADGDGNCAESCNESSDNCTAADPNGSSCNDALFCNGSDTCSAGACSVHGTSPCPGADGDGNCAESCNESTDTCNSNDPNGSSCSDGLFCNGADTCASGACSGHAGNPCPGADGDGNCAESCNESSDNCTAADTNGSPCNDTLFCNGADTCAAGACSGHAGNPCPGADGDGNCAESCNESSDNCTAADTNGSSCNDALFCNGADTCAAGACSGHAGNPCPGADGDGNCAESCSESADACTANDPNGSPCNDGLFCNGADTCASGACSSHTGDPCPGADGDGNCAESCSEASDACTAADANGSPCNDGLFCNGTDTCAAGACSAHGTPPCPGADGDSNCAETCSEAGDSCTAADPNGSPCSDGLFCNGADTCASGTCSGHAGDPCPGVDGDANCAESCNEAIDACSAADPNGSGCSDGLFCNGADTCASGACSGHAGDPCPGADGDANCAESCSEAGDACNAADTSGSACNDGLFCNGADTCASGVCSGHTGNPCPGADGDANCAESCNESTDACSASDPNGSACTDGLFCNGADSCAGGSCSTHAGDPCPGADGDGNCAESCNETSDACGAADSNGAPCDDGIFCNGADTCSGGTCSIHAGDPCPGPDGDGNCAETCNETADACSAADTNGSACNDGLFCNGADTCASGACSVHGTSPCPGADGDVDCSETCNEFSDSCTAADPNGTSCDDGLVCNGADTCAAGGCTVHTGSPCPGADGDGDCSESCSDAGQGCNGPDPAGSPCDDGIFCNGADRCAGGTCSVHLGGACPGPDGDSNCAESCNEETDSCNAVDPNDSPCSDGIFCNGADTCSAGACSQHAGNPCAGPDGDGNCAESCSENADACTAADPNGSPCSDNLFCNGADTCSAGACSQHAGNPCPGADGDGNCAETCSEPNDSCTGADPNGAACDDGVFCNGADTCAAGSCSLHAGSPCPGADGDADCAESCDEQSHLCTAADPNGGACDDGVFCNGADTCQAGMCSQHAGTPCAGADGDGNCAETCSEASHSCTAPDPDGSPCDDGVFCDGADSCAGGSCSQHEGTPCPGADGDANCAESCSEQNDSCSAPDPEGAACDDSNACTADDACNGTGTCAGGSALDCDDDDECTADGCTNVEPFCTHTDIPNCPPSTTTTTTLPAQECGDVNDDGSITAGDALAILQSSVGGPKCAAIVCTCDANASGSVTATDALFVLRFAVNLPATLDCTC